MRTTYHPHRITMACKARTRGKWAAPQNVLFAFSLPNNQAVCGVRAVRKASTLPLEIGIVTKCTRKRHLRKFGAPNSVMECIALISQELNVCPSKLTPCDATLYIQERKALFDWRKTKRLHRQ